MAVYEPDRHSRQCDRREREEDGKNRDDGEQVGAWDVPGRIPSLLRKVGNGLDSCVSDYPDRNREEEVRPNRRHSERDVARQNVRVEDEREADHYEEKLRREIDYREADVQARRLAQADDVQPNEEDDHHGPPDDVPGVFSQRPPKDREVVGDEERRDRDGDDVVEHLRPGGPEDRGDPKRVVDRRADVPVDGREEPRCTEDTLEPLPTPAPDDAALPPCRHRGNLPPGRDGRGNL